MSISGQITTNRLTVVCEFAHQWATCLNISDIFTAKIRPLTSHTVDAMKAAAEFPLLVGRRLQNFKTNSCAVTTRGAHTEYLGSSRSLAHQYQQVNYGF